MKKWPHKYLTYIILQIFEPFIIVTFALTGVVWLSRSLQFVDLIVNKGLPVSSFIWLVALIAPKILALILPIITFIAVLYCYNRLWVDSEIIVLRSFGLSRLGTIMPALIFGIIVSLFLILVESKIAPSNYKKFKDLQGHIRNNFVSSVLQEGSFHSPIPGITVFISNMNRNGQINNMLIHDQRNSKEESTIIAKRGIIEVTKYGPRFVVFDGNRQMLTKATNKISILHFESYTFDLENTFNSSEPRFRHMEERGTYELLFNSDSLDKYNRNKFKAEAHRRIMSPFIVILMSIIASSVIVLGRFERRVPINKIVYASAIAFFIQSIYIIIPSILTSFPYLSFLPYIFFTLLGSIAIYIISKEKDMNILEGKNS